jgi:hypothetical protein
MKPLRSSYPVGHLLNAQTRYVPSAQTDIRETFRRATRTTPRSAADEIADLRRDRHFREQFADLYNMLFED